MNKNVYTIYDIIVMVIYCFTISKSKKKNLQLFC